MSVPRIEALALPNPVEQTTSEPTPIWITISTKTKQANTIPQTGIVHAYKVSAGVMLSHPGHLPLTIFKTGFWNLLDFDASGIQRQVNAFNMSWTKFPPLPLRIALSLTPPYQERRGQPCLMPLKNSSKFSNIGHGYYSPLQKYIEIANTNKFTAIYFL